jgi:ABC-type multidrug transport system fused ATPase/permease subunit
VVSLRAHVGEEVLVVDVAARVAERNLLSLAVLAGLPLLIGSARWYLRRSGPAYRRLAESYSDLSAVASANVASARTIDALQLGPARLTASDDSIGATFSATMGTLYLKTVLFPATNFAFSMPVLTVLLWGGWLVGQGRSTAGAVATVTLYVVQLAAPVESLIGWLDQVQSTSVALGRLIGVQHVPPDRSRSPQTPIGPDIELRDVTFAYRPDEPVLHGVTLRVRPGERLAIVGPSGSGKSTLARIIAGVNRPDSGAATLGGVPLADRPQEQLRHDVALVTQEHHVFRSSIADNVRLGRPDATDIDVAAALRAVGADWVSILSDGATTRIGAGALQLSPAQAQQIALARLLLLDPHTLVLDEATAMIDPASARSLERSMSAALHGRTVIAIAHRLHTAQDADRVAVVIDGRLVELGTHDELLARKGDYANLWHAWQDA